MTIARAQQISLEHTRYYHCISRCVRRAFLCGKDRFTGKNFGHRRQWIENRLAQLARIFAIEILAYAVMHNHYHVVLRVTPEKAAKWSDEEIAERWSQVFSVPECEATTAEIALWRTRLTSISWFMRCINEPLARRANREDDCSGRFWEGRFKLQALLDDIALLRCMAYVDLNPVRSGLARLPETSRHTSLKARLARQDSHLVAFERDCVRTKDPIPITYTEYMRLIHWTSRCVRTGRNCRVPPGCVPILERIHLSRQQWIREIRYYGKWHYRAVGSLTVLENYCMHLGQRWLKGMGRPGSAMHKVSAAQG
jgi:REP element-mobilizing transposase RayT